MKKRRSLLHHKLQTGALGVFVCVVLVIVFGLISLQNITTTSLDLYLSNSKQHIEEARQLAYAGLRHYTHNFGNDEAIQQLIDSHQGDTRVIGECSYTVDLPETLDPQVQLASPDTPVDTRQDIVIRGIVVPYNCDHSISEENYRATFEIVASVNCSGSNGVESGCVKRSFVFNREDSNGLPYVTRKTPPPPPPPPDPNPPPPRAEPSRPPAGPPSGEVREPPPKSKGKHEVGF
ncbi:MAG: hypothetical protein V7542_01295 [Limnobacter sp.]|jgi:hypothetical protein|uniref:hypothetical protein n=1 Tax=unclassified Limnobacter TaxID=2630203 RepID=UPI000C553140|nr:MULTISPECIES: hypothetical protein [unclassified Limnobacter]MAG79609.1 hypothetical protein [Sutterellaceae bacterium]MBA4314015.1 hypothetical protein [Alcaligenaceae bacterium]MBT85464.1 hypothetical protein [Sutterellaceae bacterium]MDP3271786.1 hypothetical protein [Limnobacter sp.]MDZ4048859.1 hypothetical protein [Limnobacter sp.]|tara:strand:+ start:6475 stop:7176 length:702 start_codon:yes stop_codon:yes gene_type:complete